MDGKIILGAGVAGLGAWYADNNADIYEMDDQAGGLCGNIDVDGFHFDRAVHLSFTKNELVKELFSKTEHFIHHPIPKCWYHTLWMQHPAQNNLYPLPINDRIKAVLGFLNRDQGLADNNFKNWNRSRYGEYLWTHFLEPYNNKYWDIDLGELGCDWIGNRIYQPSIEEILYGSYTDKTPNTYYAPEMRYPKTGGYFEFVKLIARHAEKASKIHFGYKVERIDVNTHTVYFCNGKMRKYNKLYTSVPMPEFVSLVEDMPEQFRDIARFDATGVAVVSMGLKKANTSQMWFYIYDEDIMAARANMPSVKSPNNAPDNMASIQFEIYFNRKKNAPGKEECTNNCMMALERIGIADREDVIFADHQILPFGNVMLKEGDKEYAAGVISWLNLHDIYPIGRFGRWEYLWSDQSFLSGYNEMNRIE